MLLPTPLHPCHPALRWYPIWELQKELSDWNHRHLGTRMSKVDWFRVFVPAFTQSMGASCIKKGFENTGIYPVNPKVKKLQRLGPSIVTDTYSKCRRLKKCCNCLFQFLSGSCYEREISSEINVTVHTKWDFSACVNISTYLQVQMLLPHKDNQLTMLMRLDSMRQLVVRP